MSVCVRGSGPPTVVIVLPLAQSLPRERPSSAEGRASEVQRADARRSAQRVLRHLELEDDHVLTSCSGLRSSEFQRTGVLVCADY